MAEQRVRLTGWGRTAPTGASVAHPGAVDDVAALIAAAGPRGVLARGLGRSYGDAAQNAGGFVLDLGHLAKIEPVDAATGLVRCGAGAGLDALLRQSIPAGWFVAVTPGTRQVSLGGAVAADVHGKNHHRDGSIGDHVTELELVDGRGEVHTLTPADELFRATLGGMGLTGVVTSVTLRMIPIESAWIAVDTWRTAGLDETMARLVECDTRHRYSVAWIDCLAGGAALGHGVVTAGDHLPAAAAADVSDPLGYDPHTRLAVPGHLPSRLLGRGQVSLFNEAYHRRAPREALGVPTRIATFFHPLDGVSGWNRLYGPTGLLQYQFVTPDADTVVAVLRDLQSARAPGLLAVLKRLGPGNGAPLSFPAPGWTLAVDLPARSPGLGATLDAADRRVLASGGRVYLAKDARLRPELLAAMYPDLDSWRQARAIADPNGVFQSDLARRLHL